MFEEINVIDTFVVLWVVTNIVLGCYYGLARQVIQLIALVGAGMLAHYFHGEVCTWLTLEFGLTIPFQEVLTWVAVLLISYGVIRIVLFPFIKLLELEGSPLTHMNRILGGVSSACIAFFIGYIALSAITWVNQRHDDALASWTDDYSSSIAISFVEEHSAFDIIQTHEQDLLRWIADLSSPSSQAADTPAVLDMGTSKESRAAQDGLLEDARQFIGETILGLVRANTWDIVVSDTGVLFYLESHHGRELAAKWARQ